VTARSASIFDAPDIAVQLRPVQAALHSHLEIAFDDGQKIIEIVRYTPASLPTASILRAWSN